MWGNQGISPQGNEFYPNVSPSPNRNPQQNTPMQNHPPSRPNIREDFNQHQFNRDVMQPQVPPQRPNCGPTSEFYAPLAPALPIPIPDFTSFPANPAPLRPASPSTVLPTNLSPRSHQQSSSPQRPNFPDYIPAVAPNPPSPSLQRQKMPEVPVPRPARPSPANHALTRFFFLKKFNYFFCPSPKKNQAKRKKQEEPKNKK